MPIKEIIKKIKTLPVRLANRQTNTSQSVSSEIKQAVKSVGKQKKLSKKWLTIILVAILVALGFILISDDIRKIQKKKEATLLPSPTPTPVEEEIIAPSAYATDSAILKIEEDLKTLEKNLLETDLHETGLNPPVLDMKVEFKEE